MRYSLRFLFAAVTFTSVVLAVITQYGAIGFALLFPHLVVVSCLAFAAARGRWFLAAGVAAVYLFIWAITVGYGAPSVREHVQTMLIASHREHDGELSQIYYDPIVDDTQRKVRPPWFFVGNETVPCPLVVTVDYGLKSAPTVGRGGKAYFLWLLGYKVHIWDQWLWLS